MYRSLLAGRRVLVVVLDNAATVGQVRPLVPGSEGCLVIVTSRDRLSGLAVHDGARRLTLGTLPEAEAVALLRAVTSAYRPGDDVTAGFHRQAAAAWQDLRDPWHEALALDVLGVALLGTDAVATARHWKRAARLLADYDDPRAREALARIRRGLEAFE